MIFEGSLFIEFIGCFELDALKLGTGNVLELELFDSFRIKLIEGCCIAEEVIGVVLVYGFELDVLLVGDGEYDVGLL